MKTKTQYSTIMNKVALEFSKYMWYDYTLAEINKSRASPKFHSKDTVILGDHYWQVQTMVYVLCEKIPFDQVFDWYDKSECGSKFSIIQYKKPLLDKEGK